MAKRAFDKIAEGLNEALDITRGKAEPSRLYLPDTIDVLAIRRKLGFAQKAFAETFGFSTQQIRDWEQKRSAPRDAARAYLMIIDKEPDTVRRLLKKASAG